MSSPDRSAPSSSLVMIPSFSRPAANTLLPSTSSRQSDLHRPIEALYFYSQSLHLFQKSKCIPREAHPLIFRIVLPIKFSLFLESFFTNSILTTEIFEFPKYDHKYYYGFYKGVFQLTLSQRSISSSFFYDKVQEE